MLTHSFEDLVQTFRILLEANFQFQSILELDRPEAVGTIETSTNSMLNAFHNLYDLMREELNAPVDWYATPELCIILAIRNARHHNKANRIRSIYNFHTQTCDNPTDVKKYLYVDTQVPPEEEGGDCFDVPVSWADLDTLLSLPRAASRLRAGTNTLIRDYLNADLFEAEALKNNLEKQDVFINFVPLALNAGIAVYPFIKDYVTTASVEAKHFLWHFENVTSALTKEHEYTIVNFSLPN